MQKTISDADIEAIAQRVVALLETRSNLAAVNNANAGRFASSSMVMALLGYRSRVSFWQFVHSHGVPCVRLSSRRIVFDRQQLEHWIAKRSTVPKKAY